MCKYREMIRFRMILPLLGAPLWHVSCDISATTRVHIRTLILIVQMNALTPSLNLRHPTPKSIEYNGSSVRSGTDAKIFTRRWYRIWGEQVRDPSELWGRGGSNCQLSENDDFDIPKSGFFVSNCSPPQAEIFEDLKSHILCLSVLKSHRKRSVLWILIKN